MGTAFTAQISNRPVRSPPSLTSVWFSTPAHLTCTNILATSEMYAVKLRICFRYLGVNGDNVHSHHRLLLLRDGHMVNHETLADIHHSQPTISQRQRKCQSTVTRLKGRPWLEKWEKSVSSLNT